MAQTITIRARLVEDVKDGVGYPTHVVVTGAGFLQASALIDIAQQVINDYYGEYETGYLAVVDRSDYHAAQKNGEADTYRVNVIEYK